MVSSLGGSAFQGFCPPAIANSFVGVTAFSAVVGGAGAYLGGARSPEEILMGVAAGAMVGALNKGFHPPGKVNKMLDKASTAATATKNLSNKDYEQLIIDYAGGKVNSAIGLGWQFDLTVYLYEKTGLKLYFNTTLENEVNYKPIPIPFKYAPGTNSNGYMQNGKWIQTK